LWYRLNFVPIAGISVRDSITKLPMLNNKRSGLVLKL
jgi:hypothetical protein